MKSNVIWRPRGLGQPTNISPVTSHGISEHNRGDTLLALSLLSLFSPPLFPSLSSRPSNSPYFGLSFSRSRERVPARTSGETRLSSRGEQGLEGGTIIYLLSLARPRTRVNHPRLCGYCFRRVARYAREFDSPLRDRRRDLNYNPLFEYHAIAFFSSQEKCLRLSYLKFKAPDDVISLLSGLNLVAAHM